MHPTEDNSMVREGHEGSTEESRSFTVLKDSCLTPTAASIARIFQNTNFRLLNTNFPTIL